MREFRSSLGLVFGLCVGVHLVSTQHRPLVDVRLMERLCPLHALISVASAPIAPFPKPAARCTG